jgi:DNA-binding CsgD family transcriptional regulator
MIPDAKLSKREKEVLNLVLQGKSNKQIALSLDISVRTVEFHLKNIYAKFQVDSRIELILELGYAISTKKIEELGFPQLIGGEKTPKIEASLIHRWIGPHLLVPSISSVRS